MNSLELLFLLTLTLSFIEIQAAIILSILAFLQTRPVKQEVITLEDDALMRDREEALKRQLESMERSTYQDYAQKFKSMSSL